MLQPFNLFDLFIFNTKTPRHCIPFSNPAHMMCFCLAPNIAFGWRVETKKNKNPVANCAQGVSFGRLGPVRRNIRIPAITLHNPTTSPEAIFHKIQKINFIISHYIVRAAFTFDEKFPHD